MIGQLRLAIFAICVQYAASRETVNTAEAWGGSGVSFSEPQSRWSFASLWLMRAFACLVLFPVLLEPSGLPLISRLCAARTWLQIPGITLLFWHWQGLAYRLGASLIELISFPLTSLRQIVGLEWVVNSLWGLCQMVHFSCWVAQDLDRLLWWTGHVCARLLLATGAMMIGIIWRIRRTLAGIKKICKPVWIGAQPTPIAISLYTGSPRAVCGASPRDWRRLSERLIIWRHVKDPAKPAASVQIDVHLGDTTWLGVGLSIPSWGTYVYRFWCFYMPWSAFCHLRL